MTILTDLMNNISANALTKAFPVDGVSIALLLNGDSMIADVADSETNTTYLQTALSGNNVTANDIRDIAQGGTSLTYEAGGASNLNWWDERTDIKGNRYTTIINPITDKSPYTDEIVSLGTNDHGAVEGELTKAELTDDYGNYLDQKKIDFPNLENIYIAPMCRHSYSTSDTSWQLMREVQYELAEQRADCHMMPEFYDLALADTVHINGASVPIRSDRYASRIAYINGVGSKPTLGMQIDSAVMDDNGCLCTITHNDGTDWTLPNADVAKKLFRAEADGTFVNLTNHTIEKVSATQLRISGAPWSEPRLQTVWGALGSIAGGAPDYGANITPDVPLDNSEFNLPFRYTDIVPTDTDVIRSITNLAYEIRPSYAKTYDGGTNIETVQSINGKTFSNLNASNFMTYQSSAFGGVGGFRSNALNKILSADNGFASQETLFFGLTIDVPASLAGNSYIFTLGTSNTISTGAQFYIDTSGRIRYSTNQAGGQANFGGDLRGGRHAILFNFTAFDNCDVYVDSVDSPLASLDLSNTYAFQNDLMFGGGSTSTLDYGLFFAKLGSHDAVNDPSLAAIMADLKTKFNIT